MDGNLLQILEKEHLGLNIDTVAILAKQLSSAIRWCHYKSVVHRDIKPENILVNKRLVLKLCDFGFARSLSNGDVNLTDYVSTRWYRAPELLIQSTVYDYTIDCWAFGCIICEMVIL